MPIAMTWKVPPYGLRYVLHLPAITRTRLRLRVLAHDGAYRLPLSLFLTVNGGSQHDQQTRLPPPHRPYRPQSSPPRKTNIDINYCVLRTRYKPMQWLGKGFTSQAWARIHIPRVHATMGEKYRPNTTYGQGPEQGALEPESRSTHDSGNLQNISRVLGL